MGENEYRIFGAMYVTLGLFFCFFFSYITTDIHLTSSVWQFGPSRLSFPLFIFSIVALYGSLLLVLFGFILLVRGFVWVARFGGILCVNSLLCYLLVLYYPFTLVSGP